MEYKGVMHNGLIQPIDPVDFPDGTQFVFHEVHNGTSRPGNSMDGSTFHPGEARFRQLSIEQLSEEQGVQPCASIDKLAGEWPEGDDLDEFLSTLREWRR